MALGVEPPTWLPVIAYCAPPTVQVVKVGGDSAQQSALRGLVKGSRCHPTTGRSWVGGFGGDLGEGLAGGLARLQHADARWHA